MTDIHCMAIIFPWIDSSFITESRRIGGCLPRRQAEPAPQSAENGAQGQAAVHTQVAAQAAAPTPSVDVQAGLMSTIYSFPPHAPAAAVAGSATSIRTCTQHP